MTVANVQITQVLLKRGNTVRSEQYTGPRSELTHDTGPAGNGPHSVRIHDGQTPGGTLLATNAQIDAINSTLANVGIVSVAYGNANVAAYLIENPQSGTYSNSNVASYLPTSSIITSINSNILATNTSIQTLSANVGAFENYANAHFLTQQIQSDWNQATTGNVAYIKNKPDLSVYATRTYVNNAVANVTITPGGSNTQVQFNDNGTFAGHPNFTFNKDTDTLRTPNSLIVNNVYSVDSTTVHVYDDLETLGAFTAQGIYLADGGSFISLDGNTAALTAHANLQIATDNGTQWTFDNTGNIVFPDYTVQTTAYPGPQDLSIYAPLNNPTFPGNVNIAGNLFVNGNVTYISANNLVLDENIIYLAQGNPANTVDIGLMGSFTDAYQHTGLIRQASTNTWKLFSNITTEPGLTVDFTGVEYDTLQLGNLIAEGTVYTPSIHNGDKAWTFNTDGTLNLPLTAIGASDQIKYGTGNLVVWNDGGWALGVYNGTDLGTDGMRLSPGIEGNVEVILPANQDAGTNSLQLNNYVGNVQVNANNNYWVFGNDGNLTLPQTNMTASPQPLSYPGITFTDGTFQNTAWKGATTSNTAPTTDAIWYDTNDGRLYIKYNNTWVDASPTVAPPPSYYLGNLTVTDRTIYSDEAGWTFGADGNLTFSDGTSQRTAAGVTVGNTAPSDSKIWYNTNDGRTYIKFGNTWVDESPTVAPAPSYYLGNLTVDGDVINFTNGTLTIDSTGNLLVNGSLVTGSGGGGSTYGNVNVAQYLNHYDNQITWTDGTNILVDSGLYLSSPDTVGITSGSAAWTFTGCSALNWPSNLLTISSYGGNASWSTPGSTTMSAVYGFTFNAAGGVYQWNFDNTGNLVLPNNGNINFANGVNILSTITAGSTYSNANVTAYLAANSISVTNNTLTGTGANVTLTADTKDWVFDSTGNLTVPGRILSETIPAAGSIAVAGEPSFSYGGTLAVFASGDFSVGALSDVQAGWTVTDNQGFTDTILSINDPFGGAIKTTSINWPTGGGRTYTFTSADYALETPTNLVLGTGNGVWTFDTADNLIVPGDILAQEGNDLKLQVFNPNSSGGVSFVIQNRQVDLDNDRTTQFAVTPVDIQLTTDFSGVKNKWTFEQNGNLTLPTNSAAINYANGQSILSGIGGGPLSINDLTDVDTVSTPPSVGQVLKWNGTNWVPAVDATTGGGGTDADLLDGFHGSYYLDYNNFSNVPNLSVYATVSSLNTFEANVGSFYTWANTHFSTSTYSNSNVASYLTAQGIAPQLQSDYTQSDAGNVSYIKNKPDLSVYATNTSLQTLNANVGAYETWANATFATTSSLSGYATTTQFNTLNANVGAYETWANANVAGLYNSITGANTNISNLQANVGSFYTWANLNYGTSSYANANVAAYLTSQGISAQLQSDWNQATTGNVTYIKNKPDLSVYATNTALQTLNANVGAYETWANLQVQTLNANLGTATTNITTLFSNAASQQTTLDALSANVGGFETWANVNYVTGTSQGLVVASNVSYYPNVTATTSTATFYPGLYNTQSGNLATYTSSNISYQPSSGNLTLAGNIQANGGYFRTTATTAYVVNSTPTTVYVAGGATIGTYIGNASGVTQLYGNVQGSTNGFAIGYRDIPQVTFTGNTTIGLADAGKHYYSTQSTSYILTVANNATVSFSVGTAINVINQGTGTITVAPASGVTMYLAGNSTSGSRTISSYGMATLQKVATDTWFLVGVGLA